MYFTTSKDTIFHTLFNTLQDIDYESFIFKITPENIHIQSTDVAKISILDMIIDKAYFTDYNVKESCTIDIDINIINKICKVFNKKYDIKFTIKENYLYIESIRNTINDTIKKFRINANYINDDDFIDISKIEYNKSYLIDSKVLVNIFSEIFIFSDDINLTINEKNMCFSANHDLGDIQYYLDNIKNDNEVNCSFKLKYLVKFKLNQLFENIKLKIENDKPILLDLEKDNIKIKYMIAPNYV
tara:strand:- start:524 stop:1252 length:729 start_codon:yes stop_codon:yes gene_type:complete